jgi:hypothetical protein
MCDRRSCQHRNSDCVKECCLLRLLAVALTAVAFCGCCQKRVVASANSVHLRLNESRTAVVPAGAYWTGTGVIGFKDETYSFHVLSPDRWWDFYYPTSSRGYNSLPLFQARLEHKRRVPSAPWFALCGAVGPSGAAFQIETEKNKTMPETGEIGLFPNDVQCAYWNNWGSLRVRVTRLR